MPALELTVSSSEFHSYLHTCCFNLEHRNGNTVQMMFNCLLYLSPSTVTHLIRIHLPYDVAMNEMKHVTITVVAGISMVLAAVFHGL